MSRELKISNPEGLYFLTWATVGWIDVFSRQVYRDLLLEHLKFSREKKGFNIHAWCLMSNHIHLIASTQQGINMSHVLRDLKGYSSKKLLAAIETEPTESRKDWMLHQFGRAGRFNPNNLHYQFWQQDNHPIELITHDFTMQKLEYIHNNPVTAGWVDYPHEYRYSSARDYAGIKGLLDIDMLF